MFKKIIVSFVCALSLNANASMLSAVSPTSHGMLPTTLPGFGGAVVDIITTDNTRVLSYISYQDLFKGVVNKNKEAYINGHSSQEIGSVIYDTAASAALRKGIAELAVRFSMFDGDNAKGSSVMSSDVKRTKENADYREFHDSNNNYLFVNGVNFGDFSYIETITTDRYGDRLYDNFDATGFAARKTGTGWFYTKSQKLLAPISESLEQSSRLALDFVVKNSKGKNWVDFSVANANAPRPPSHTTVSVNAPSSIVLLVLLIGSALVSLRLAIRFKAGTSQK